MTIYPMDLSIIYWYLKFKHEWPKELLSVPHNTFIDFHQKQPQVLRDNHDWIVKLNLPRKVIFVI